MNKFVLYFAGGTMRGVFGAGVATAFQENNIYPRISAVYTASAGVMTGAYFLAKQTKLGPSIYWEDLGKNFISRRDFLIGVWQRFQNEFIKSVPDEKLRDAINVEHLMGIIKEKKRLDAQHIISQTIPLYIKLFNLDTNSLKYIDARRPDIFDILKAGINVFPYVHEVSSIDGVRYIDAAIMDSIGLEALRERHPADKIILILNGQLDRKLRYRIKNIVEGKFMQWMFRSPPLYGLYASAEDKLKQDVARAHADDKTLIIAPAGTVRVKSRTTNPKPLLKMYELGKSAGREALQSNFMA